MEPISIGQKPSASVPQETAEVLGYSGWLTRHPTSRLPLCKAIPPNALPTANNICAQRLLVFSSFEPPYRAKRDNIRFRDILLPIRHRLCIDSNMATAVCLSLVTRHWDWN